MSCDARIICSRQDLMGEMVSLIQKLEKSHKQECYPRKAYVECPPEKMPDPIVVPHPYIAGVKLTNRPRAMQQNVKVTLDGRMAEHYQPREFYFDEPPIRLPPWFRPRISSTELRGGVMMTGCDCWKKNGLQDDCRRWDCQRPECWTQPLPECPPSFDPPLTGVRKGNAMLPPLMKRAKKVLPDYPAYPLAANEMASVTYRAPPNPAADKCPLHYLHMPLCS